jgi:4,5-dihydroxyphthalate decarboxylase
MSWVIGGTDHPIPAFGWIPQPVLDGIDVRHAGPDQTLAAMLEEGEIDALLSVAVPQSLLDGSTRNIRRLFPDYERVERDYYRRTAIFPMMHVIASAVSWPPSPAWPSRSTARSARPRRSCRTSTGPAPPSSTCP